MPPSLINLQQRINQLALRERALVAACLLAVIFLIWELVLQSPIDKQTQTLNTQIAALHTQREAVEEKINQLIAVASNDQSLPKKQTLKQLQNDLVQLDNQLSEVSEGLVRADELPQILQDVLVRTSDLKLLQMQTLPVQELQFRAPVTETLAKGEVAAGAGVYKHTVSLRLSGSYFQVLRFLQSLENDKWHFYWDQLDYRVTQYPQAEVELRVYTLTADKGLLGV